MPEPTPEALNLLSALHWPGVGVVRARQLARQAVRGDREEYLDLLRNIRGAKAPSGAELQKASARAAAVADDCTRLGIWVLCVRDDAYPEHLRVINDAPPILYVKGDTKALGPPCVAVVGTRKASERGLNAARKIAGVLASARYGVVSGLALGIDTAAHEGTLDANGRTVAVLAHGLDTVSPKANQGLAERLLGHEGALVSEHPPGVPARRAEFVRRNRIQSGLSIGSVIVESAEKGGAVHQARFTHAQGRLLFVVLPKGGGSSQPFQDGGAKALVEELDAIPVSSAKPLLEQLGGEGSLPARTRRTAHQERLF